MEDFATLGLAVDASQVKQATKSLEDLALAGRGAEAATDRLTRSSGRMALSYSMQQDAISKVSSSTFEASTQVQRLMDRYDPLGTKLRSLQADFAALSAAAGSGQLGADYDATVDKTYAALNAEISQTKSLMEEAGAGIASGASSLDNLSFSSGMARRQLMMLGKDVMTGDVSNIPNRLSMIAIQSNALALAMTPIGGAVLGITAALGAGGYAWYKWGKDAEDAAEKIRTALTDRVVTAMKLAEDTKNKNSKEVIADMESQIAELEKNALRIENRARMARMEADVFNTGKIPLSTKQQLVGSEAFANKEALENLRRNLADAKKADKAASPETASQKFVEGLERELFAIGKSSVALRERDITLMKLTGTIRDQALALVEEIDAMAKQNAQANAFNDAATVRTDAVAASAEAERKNAFVIGKTGEELARLEIATLSEMAASKDRLAVMFDEVDWSGKTGDSYRAEAAALRDLAKAKGETLDKVKSTDDIARVKKESEEAAKAFESVLSDTFVMAMQGKFDSIGDMFKQMLLRMAADALAAKLTQSLFPGTAAPGIAGAPAGPPSG